MYKLIFMYRSTICTIVLIVLVPTQRAATYAGCRLVRYLIHKVGLVRLWMATGLAPRPEAQTAYTNTHTWH